MCLFHSLVDDIHILGLAHFVSLAFDHFVSQLAYVGLFVQLYKCSTWAPSSLPPRFAPPVEFCCSYGGIKILGIPFDFVSFASIFFTKGFKQGCSTCKCVPEIKGHPGGFCYPLLMFHPKAFFFRFFAFPPFQIKSQLTIFYYTTWGIF